MKTQTLQDLHIQVPVEGERSQAFPLARDRRTDVVGVNGVLPLLQAMRPKQWVKNLVIFAGIIFSHRLLIVEDLIRTLAAFGLFCLLASSIYLINDIFDLEKDRAHPVKSRRPLASGRLSVAVALFWAIVLAGTASWFSLQLDVQFFLVTSSYFIAFVLYSKYLKRLPIVDVLLISSGFVLRAVAGALVIHVNISNWLLICTIFLALFLALCKRRHELTLLGESSGYHRETLRDLSPHLLDQMVSVVTASTVMSYALYALAPETIARFGSQNLLFTIPFVLYGVFRYLYLVHQKNMGDHPEAILVRDKPMIINLLLYASSVYLLIYVIS